MSPCRGFIVNEKPAFGEIVRAYYKVRLVRPNQVIHLGMERNPRCSILYNYYWDLPRVHFVENLSASTPLGRRRVQAEPPHQHLLPITLPV